ncbi:MAG: tyrosine--tRNA ligase [Hyphomicrobiales bacterium]
MVSFTSDFLHILQERGFIYQSSHPRELDRLLRSRGVTAYIGFDCTARSLHVGNLVQIMMLRWLQKTGHRPIVLMGGGTTRIGDPSGRDETRKLLSPDTIESNKAGLNQVFSRFLTFGDSPGDAIMADNAEWLLTFNYIDFLRAIGRHFSVNRMLSMDSVRLRLEREQALSFLEFNYMVLQAYDFVELNRRFNCRLQLGGSDQWGNLVQGIDLVRRVNKVEVFALTTPLITTASGAKMGKTQSGAIWLTGDMSDSYEYWQFWRNTEDEDVGRFLRLFTEIPGDEIARLERLQGRELNEAKKILANEATTLLHGRRAAQNAAETAHRTFVEGGSDANLPTVTFGRGELAGGIGLLTAMVRAGLVGSNGEARRAIAGGGVRVNGKTIDDPKAILTSKTLTNDGTIKLSMGKKRHILIRPTGA